MRSRAKRVLYVPVEGSIMRAHPLFVVIIIYWTRRISKNYNYTEKVSLYNYTPYREGAAWLRKDIPVVR